MALDLLFKNAASGGGNSSPTPFLQDAFQDISLPASNNIGSSSTFSSNPLNYFYANTDSPQYSVKTLYIKDLVLIQDRSLWISNKPTYEIIWNECFPAARGYVFGSPQIVNLENGKYVWLSEAKDGFGVGGIIRRVHWLVEGLQGGILKPSIDAVNGSNFTISANNTLFQNKTPEFNAIPSSSSNSSYDIHDFRVTVQSTARLIGAVIYYENSGANLDFLPGNTYLNKTKVTTTSGATLALPSYGSSLGGKSVLYKTTGGAYTQSALTISTITSAATGTTGTNTLTVTTGQGSSFSIGDGVIAAFGSTTYVGNIQSISTDTLTVSPTLSFGISGPIYRYFSSGISQTINASLMELAYSIDLNAYAGFTDYLTNSTQDWILSANNCTFGIYRDGSLTAVPINAFQTGSSGYIQIDGFFSAADMEFIGTPGIGATIAINGAPAFGMSAYVTLAGVNKITLMNDAGPGWNSIAIPPTANNYMSAITRFNLYRRKRDSGVTFGALAEFETLQAFSDRGIINATMMAPGTYKRYYADQLPTQGPWSRAVDSTAPGAVYWRGSTSSCGITFSYFGKNFGMIGVAGTSWTLSLDGSALGTTLNHFFTVASEGFHTVSLKLISGTFSIGAIDIQRSNAEIKNLQNYNPIKSASGITSLPVPTTTDSNYAISTVSGVTTGGNGSWTALGLKLKTPSVPNSLWLLHGSLIFGDGGTAPNYALVNYVWSSTDGDNTSSQPTLATPVSGFAGPISATGLGSNGSFGTLLKTTEIILGPNQTVYLVPYNSELIANDVLISGQITAQRIK